MKFAYTLSRITQRTELFHQRSDGMSKSAQMHIMTRWNRRSCTALSFTVTPVPPPLCVDRWNATWELLCRVETLEDLVECLHPLLSALHQAQLDVDSEDEVCAEASVATFPLPRRERRPRADVREVPVRPPPERPAGVVGRPVYCSTSQPTNSASSEISISMFGSLRTDIRRPVEDVGSIPSVTPSSAAVLSSSAVWFARGRSGLKGRPV